MTDRPRFSEPPRFNHVAMSMSPDALDEAPRADILSFYGSVFGWEELPTMTVDRERLVLAAYRHDQFVFLIADDAPMQAPRLDHFGMSVASLDELHDVLARAKAVAATDDRVDIIDHSVEDHEVDGQVILTLHSFYVGFLLPMMVEVQYWAWA